MVLSSVQMITIRFLLARLLVAILREKTNGIYTVLTLPHVISAEELVNLNGPVWKYHAVQVIAFIV